MLKLLRLSAHAKVALAQRSLDIVWVERTVEAADWIEIDPSDETVERRFGVTPERDGRFLRVACRETDHEVFVISCFLDRKARRPL